jgi:hypothetical protein
MTDHSHNENDASDAPDVTRVKRPLNRTILGEYLHTKEKRLLLAFLFQLGGLTSLVSGFIRLYFRYFGAGGTVTNNHLFFGQLLWSFAIGLFAITVALAISSRRQAFAQSLVPCALAVILLYLRP